MVRIRSPRTCARDAAMLESMRIEIWICDGDQKMDCISTFQMDWAMNIPLRYC
jgi:hypothetical protein